MIALHDVLAGTILVSLTFYVLMGGADFGAGIWSLFARGPRARAHQELVAGAIAPIWEANHVWLILVVTILFTAFPQAFALIMTVLHIPVTLMLVGVVLRGSAFAFRGHAASPGFSHWNRLFALSSLLTPVLLGVTLGAIASGRLAPVGDGFAATFVWPWLAPFPIMVGVLTLLLFALLSTVYLVLDTDDPELREDYRRRALASGGLTAAVSLVVLALCPTGAPRVWDGLIGSWWSAPLLALAVGSALGCLAALWVGRLWLARALAAVQVTLMIWGWAFAQYPYLVEPSLTIEQAAAPRLTLTLVLLALLAGAVILFPSLYYLYAVFKPHALFRGSEQPRDSSATSGRRSGTA